ncbi:hypothetical protein LEN26_012149 [Aphanomyces euteiches]|nr:hypothetical protein LEN26_012149 [Aphanomyces euteiches]
MAPRDDLFDNETTPLVSTKISIQENFITDQRIDEEAGVVALDSLEAVGLFAQFGGAGFLMTFFPALGYPIFNVYLAMDGYQTASYGVLVNLGWSFKFIFGILSDCFPIYGYHRKSWMLVGWIFSIGCLLMMVFVPFGAPYCDRAATKAAAAATLCTTPIASVSQSELLKYFNLQAPDQGSFFIVMSMIVSFGYVLVEVCAEVMAIEYSQREPIAMRGRVQSMAYACRYAGGLPAHLILALGLNGVQYNGSFTFSLAPNAVYATALVPCIVAAIAAIFFVQDRHHSIPLTGSSSSSSFLTIPTWWRSFWTLLERQTMWQMCIFQLASTTLRGVVATPLNPIRAYWAHVEPAASSISSVVGVIVITSSLTLMHRHGLHWNWRACLAIATIATVVIDATAVLLTTWNIIRNQWFFVSLTMAGEIPDAFNSVIGSVISADLSDASIAGATQGLLSTMINLAWPIAAMIYNIFDSFFDVGQDAIKTDSTAVRRDVTIVFLFSYACKLSGLLLLLLLPSQHRQLQDLKRDGITSSFAATTVLAVAGFGLVFSVTSNLLAVFPATKCFRIAGGNGEVGPDGWCQH